ncbi:type II toxin-antitoxin system PemK/MazF family toxin [Shewanella baltica]|uniref:type II toxin-antitoxin system PemK/MazF family toxin n=2 Tax=Shewanella baltica TaxID=62322 RepID=UPI0022217423|nr:type II toxin-antitoxin system PemK/MazF family toxin [Shewanella baltica]
MLSLLSMEQMDLSVNYYLAEKCPNGQYPLLGTEISQNFSQILCPSNAEHSVTITKFFTGQTTHRWKVEEIQYPNDYTTNIFLRPRNECITEVFLTKTRKSHPAVTQKFQRGTLVDVEYGFVQQVRKSNGLLATNKRYPDLLHNAEMHKRRLAVVIGIKGSLVRIAPVTSVEEQDLSDKTVIELSMDSLKNLSSYNNPDKASYVLCNMIQTVAASRILPPLTRKNGGPPFRDVTYPHKLKNQDLKLFEVALSAAVGCGDYKSVKDERNMLRLEMNNLKTQVEDLTTACQTLQAENSRLNVLENRYKAMLELMTDWKRAISNRPMSDIYTEIHDEIDQYVETLQELTETA